MKEFNKDNVKDIVGRNCVMSKETAIVKIQNIINQISKLKCPKCRNLEVIASGTIIRYTGLGSKDKSFEQYCIIPAGKDITDMREAEVIDYKFEDYENQEIEILVRKKGGK